jgi:diguanylate cyclase (GGDEF)-like protein
MLRCPRRRPPDRLAHEPSSHERVLTSLDRDNSRIFIFSVQPGRLEVRLALVAGVCIVGLCGLAAIIPAGRLGPEPGFIAAYAATLSLGAFVVAILLFAQFFNLGSLGLLVLANGSLFTAIMAVLTLVANPAAMRASNPSGDSSGAAWFSVFWHFVYPATVLVYAALGRKRASSDLGQGRGVESVGAQALVGGFIVLAATLGAVILAHSHGILPALVMDDRYTAADRPLALAIAVVTVAAAAGLFTRRPRSVLDLWLLVGMVAWLADAVLTAVCHGRYELSWYAARVMGGASIGVLLLALLIESAAHYGRLFELNEALLVSNRALEHLSLHDALTGLPNRRYFDTYLGRQASLMRRHKRNLALVLCDVDSFKAFNDLYGHVDGDECLTRVAVALRTCCRRPADMAARYGGEEFALILPETDIKGARRIAEAAREAVARVRIPHARSAAGPMVTISAGVAVLDGRTDMSIETLVEAADAGLMRAKATGRNRVVATTDAEDSGSG